MILTDFRFLSIFFHQLHMQLQTVSLFPLFVLLFRVHCLHFGDRTIQFLLCPPDHDRNAAYLYSLRNYQYRFVSFQLFFDDLQGSFNVDEAFSLNGFQSHHSLCHFFICNYKDMKFQNHLCNFSLPHDFFFSNHSSIVSVSCSNLIYISLWFFSLLPICWYLFSNFTSPRAYNKQIEQEIKYSISLNAARKMIRLNISTWGIVRTLVDSLTKSMELKTTLINISRVLSRQRASTKKKREKVWEGSLSIRITRASREKKQGLRNPKHKTRLRTLRLWSKWNILDFTAKVKAIIKLIVMRSALVSAN